MPRIPIIRPPADSGGPGTGDGPEMLSPPEAAGLRTLETRTARIDRELAVSQSWLAGLARLAAAEDAPEGPSPGFARSFLEEADRERALALKPLSPDRQAPLEQDLMALRQGFAERAAAVEADGMALRRRIALHRTLEGYRTGVARDPGLYDDAAGRMQALVADLGLADERKHALDLHVRDALGNAAVDGLMKEPERAERLLSSGLYDDALTEASKASRLTEAQTLVARNRLLARERTLSDLTAQADEGVASDDAIAAAARDGILTAAEAEHLRARNLEAGQATERRQARIQRVASAATLDPSDPEDKAAADAYWEEVSEAYASDDAEAQRKAELSFVQRVGVLPDGLKRKYQGALLSADPAIAASGATAIDQLNRLSPALVADIPTDERQRAMAIAEYAAFDLPPERAIELANRKVEQSDTEPDTTAAGPADPPVARGDEPAEGQIESGTDDGHSAEEDMEPVSGGDAGQSTAQDAAATDVGDLTEGASGERIDGVTVVVDPDTGERTTVDEEAAERLRALAAEHEALIGLQETYLDLYDGVASGEITREEATRLLLDHIKETLPSENEAGSPLSTDRRLRLTLQRLATDIFDARDRADAEKLFTDEFITTASIQEIGEFILSIAPVTGEFISAKDAYHGFVAAIEAWRRGDDDAMLREGAWATLAAVGALPLIGYLPRLGRAGLKAFRTTRQLLENAGRRTPNVGGPHRNGLHRPKAFVREGVNDDRRMGQIDPGDPTSYSFPVKSGRLILDQGQEQTCAAHSVAMALHTLGKPQDVEDVKKLMPVHEFGPTVFDITDTLEEFGIKFARAINGLTPKKLAKHIDETHPAIAGVEVTAGPNGEKGYHAIVIDRLDFRPKDRFTQGVVVIRDPAGGREYVTTVIEFQKKFTGIAIVTKPHK